MKSPSFASIGVPCPDRVSISRLVLLICCVGLLVGPTVGAVSGGQSPSAVPPPTADQQAPRSLQASGQNNSTTPTASRSANRATSTRNGQNNNTTPTPPTDPSATIENVTLLHGEDSGPIAPDMTVDVMKVNKSTVAIVYRHNQTTKTWYTTDKDVVTSPRWDNPNDTSLPQWMARRFAGAIEETQVFKQQIKPFALSPDSYPKTGTAGYRQEARENPQKFPHIPGPVEAAKDIYRAAVNGLSSAAADFIDGFHWVVLHLPAPGTPSAPTTWFSDTATPLNTSTSTVGANGSAGPNTTVSANGSSGTNNSTAIPTEPPQKVNVDGWWQAVWTIYGGLASLVVLPVFVAWIYGWAKETNTPRERDQYVRQLASTLGLVLGGVLLLPFALHLTNELALGIVPDGQAFMQTPGNVAKLGMGLALGGVLLVVESGLVIVALVVLFVEWVLVYLLVAGWPLFAVCLGSGNRYLRPYGESAAVAFVSLLVLKLVQAIWLRFLLELPLSWDVSGLMTIGATIVGLLIGFIYLPYYVVTNLLPEFVTTVGGGRAGSVGGSRQFVGDTVTAQGSERQRSARTTVTRKDGESAAARTRTRSSGLDAQSSVTATDGGPSSQAQAQSARGRDRARRVAAIRQRAYRQDDTFDQFPDNGDVTDTVARTRTTADIGSTGRTPDGAAGAVTETTETAVGTAESAAGKVGTAVAVAAEARRTAKSHWYGVKRYWRSALPGHRSRRPTKPVAPLRQKARRQAKSGWQSVKQHGRAGKDRVVDRDRRQRQDQRRDHVREQHSVDETTADATTESDTETTTTSTEETATDETATERRRYYTRQDHQKYGDALSERQKSSIRRHAERRYRSRTDAADSSKQTSHATDEGEKEAPTETDTDETETEYDHDN
jgi:hypothetical protein